MVNNYDPYPLNCISCQSTLELLESMNPIFNRRVYGCQRCDAVFDFRATTGCNDPGGLTKRRESLTEYKKEIADQPQAEIRRKKELYKKSLKVARNAKVSADSEYVYAKANYDADLKNLQNECKHPNKQVGKRGQEVCSDCDWEDLEYR